MQLPPTTPSTVDQQEPSTYPIPGPCYKSVGDEAKDRLAFFHVLERLKTQKRGGWVREGVRLPESISDHMYRMSLMALCIPDGAGVDVGKCVMMALVHDLAEAHCGDITPVDGISREQKLAYEREAMESFLNEMLGSESAASKRISALWEEYEAGATKEAKFVKDLDRFELACQGVEYERDQPHLTQLQPFFSGTPKIQHPVVKGWAQDVMKERDEIWSKRGVSGRGWIWNKEGEVVAPQ